MKRANVIRRSGADEISARILSASRDEAASPGEGAGAA
jgi:hypothetical protein